jgi:hypothetical protein
MALSRLAPSFFISLLLLAAFVPTAQANLAPVAVAGEDQEVNVGQMVMFGASDSYDPDGDPLSYSWDFDDSNGIQSESILIAPRHTYDEPGFYLVTLTVSDGLLNSTDDIMVKVNPNMPPIIDLGPDLEVAVLETFYLDTRNVSDPNMDALEYSWDFDDSDGIQVDSTEKFPNHRYDKAGEYTITLTVTDGEFTVEGIINVTAGTTLIPVTGKRFGEDNYVRPSVKRTYLIPISSGKGLDVKLESLNGVKFHTYLFTSKNFFKYTDNGALVAISQGSKENATKHSYSVKISNTDDYYLMIMNPTLSNLSYRINIKIEKVGTSSGFIPGPGIVDAVLTLIFSTMVVATVARRARAAR